MNPPPPLDAADGEWASTLRWMQQWFEFIQAVFDDANRRLDHQASRAGVVDERMEMFANQIQRSSGELARIAGLVESQNKLILSLTGQVDTKMQLASASVNRIEQQFGDVSARYQQSINELNRDTDERFVGLETELRGEMATLKREIKEDLAAQRREESTIAVARIGRNERVIIAVFAGIVSLLTALLANLAIAPH